MNEEERKCLNDCGFANVTQLLLAYVSVQQENARLKDKIEKGIDKLEFYNSGEALWYVPIQEIIDILKEN